MAFIIQSHHFKNFYALFKFSRTTNFKFKIRDFQFFRSKKKCSQPNDQCASGPQTVCTWYGICAFVGLFCQFLQNNMASARNIIGILSIKQVNILLGPQNTNISKRFLSQCIKNSKSTIVSLRLSTNVAQNCKYSYYIILKSFLMRQYIIGLFPHYLVY